MNHFVVPGIGLERESKYHFSKENIIVFLLKKHNLIIFLYEQKNAALIFFKISFPLPLVTLSIRIKHRNMTH